MWHMFWPGWNHKVALIHMFYYWISSWKCQDPGSFPRSLASEFEKFSGGDIQNFASTIQQWTLMGDATLMWMLTCWECWFSLSSIWVHCWWKLTWIVGLFRQVYQYIVYQAKTRKYCQAKSRIPWSNMKQLFNLAFFLPRNAVIRAASRAALRSDEGKRCICMADLRYFVCKLWCSDRQIPSLKLTNRTWKWMGGRRYRFLFRWLPGRCVLFQGGLPHAAGCGHPYHS